MIALRPFLASDQAAAKALVQAGLGEHWGWVDQTLNPDLNDIAASYRDGVFLIAEHEAEIVATGAYLPVGPGVVQIVRMSVRADCRRLGLGRRMLASLQERARAAGSTCAVLETTKSWHEVIAFYVANGFAITHQVDDDMWFACEL